MKKVCLLIACLTTISIVSFAQSEQQRKPSPKPNPVGNTKAEPSQTAPENPAIEKAPAPAVDPQNPAIDKAEIKEKETKAPPADKSGNHPNGANAHGMEMKEKNHEKQLEKKAEHVEKKEKQAEKKAIKKK